MDPFDTHHTNSRHRKKHEDTTNRAKIARFSFIHLALAQNIHQMVTSPLEGHHDRYRRRRVYYLLIVLNRENDYVIYSTIISIIMTFFSQGIIRPNWTLIFDTVL